MGIRPTPEAILSEVQSVKSFWRARRVEEVEEVAKEFVPCMVSWALLGTAACEYNASDHTMA